MYTIPFPFPLHKFVHAWQIFKFISSGMGETYYTCLKFFYHYVSIILWLYTECTRRRRDMKAKREWGTRRRSIFFCRRQEKHIKTQHTHTHMYAFRINLNFFYWRHVFIFCVLTLKTHSFSSRHSIYMRLKYFMVRRSFDGCFHFVVAANFCFISPSITHLNFNWMCWKIEIESTSEWIPFKKRKNSLFVALIHFCNQNISSSELYSL